MVRRPSVQLNAVGAIKTHGPQQPVRGVWHDTESHDVKGIHDLEGIVNYWVEQDLGYGAHLIIDREGNSAYCADVSNVTWAVENHNTGTVSIELVGFASFKPDVWLLRRAQLDKLAKWMAWLRKEHSIKLVHDVNHGWSTHGEQSKAFGGTHTDPGKFFPCNYVLRKAHNYFMNGW